MADYVPIISDRLRNHLASISLRKVTAVKLPALFEWKLVLLVSAILCASSHVMEDAFAEDKPIKRLILPGQSFLVEGRPAFILTPKVSASSGRQPWVFYAPTLDGYPDEHEKWMHEQFLNAGVAVAGIDDGEGYGSPKANHLFTAFYNEVTKNRNFSLKPCMLGRSRGGLWVSSWASENTDKVSGIAGIYPVFDFRTYPGLANAAGAYELTAEQLGEQQQKYNPIERIKKLAEAKIPATFIHGDQDTVVPLKENSAEFLSRYQAAGQEKLVHLIVAQGQGHNFWEGFFRCQELIDFSIARAREGALTK